MSIKDKPSLCMVVADIDFFFSHRAALAKKLSEKFQIIVISDIQQSNELKKVPLVITLGEPAGIGPEIICKAKKHLRESVPFFVIGDFELIKKYADKQNLKTKLVAIDDLIREHKADLIIDQTVGREICEYQSTSPESEVITGTKFALLNIKFAEMHPLAVNKRIDTQEHRLLLTMGGVDSPNATLETLSALKQRTTPIPTTVLLCKDAPHYLSVSSFCEKNSDWISHIQFSNSMATLMFEHTLAIGAPGSTSWE